MSGTLDDGVDHGTPPTGFSSSDEEEVLLSNSSGSHGVFDLIIIDLDEPIVHVGAKSRPLPKGVADGLPEEALGKMFPTFLKPVQGLIDPANHWPTLMLANGLPKLGASTALS